MKQLLMTIGLVAEFCHSAECRLWLRMAVKPLAVIVMMAGLLWLGGWLDTRLAHAQSQTPIACVLGETAVADKCYKVCPPDFEAIPANGLTCLQKCPSGYADDGLLCRKDAQALAKQVYGRGAGVGLLCAANQEAQGGLCYPRCAPGYYGVGPVCWQSCKPGYADHGATCFRHIFDFYGKPTYGRGAGGAVSVCPVGLEQSGGFCYPRCASGFFGVGALCSQQCPPNTKDEGAFCRKDAHIFAKAIIAREVDEHPNHPPVLQNGPIVPVAKNDDAMISNPPATDEDGDSIVHSEVVRLPQHGRLYTDPLWVGLAYYPNPGFEGVDTLDWHVGDGKHWSNVATITFLVGVQPVAVNVEPVAIDRTLNLTEETPITMTVTCTDANNDPLSYRLVDKPQHGSYRWLSSGQVVYTPAADFVGTDRFTFRAYDGRSFSNTSVVTLTVAAVNDAPVAQAQPISTTRNSNAAITLFATDAEGDAISYTLVSSPTHGSLSGEIPNLLYTPQANFVGEDSFQFRATDTHGDATVATVYISVLPANTAPLAASLVLTTMQESALAVNLSASDADGDALLYSVVTSPTHGLLNGAGADLIYTPNAGFIGTDSFTFKSNDSQADSPVTMVTIHVTAAPNEASVGGLVYEDRNGNGQPDGDDVGVPGLLVILTPASGGAGEVLRATTEAGGGWRIEGVPFGEYTVKVVAANGVQIEKFVEVNLTVGQRGLQQLQPANVKVTARLVYLPVVVR